MNNSRGPRYYLIAAIIWTVIAVVATVLLMISEAAAFPKACGLFLVVLCVVGQWLRYRKMK